MNFLRSIGVEVAVVVPPVMGKIRAYENDVSGMETFDVIPHELCTATLVKIDEFDLGMIMPAIIDIGVPVFANAEGMSRGPGDFQ